MQYERRYVTEKCIKASANVSSIQDCCNNENLDMFAWFLSDLKANVESLECALEKAKRRKERKKA